MSAIPLSMREGYGQTLSGDDAPAAAPAYDGKRTEPSGDDAMKYLFVTLIPLLIVAAVYVWRDAIDRALPALKGWRTVLLNAIPAVGIVITDLAAYLAGFNWNSVVSAETAAMLMLAFNIVNIALRALTTTPIGKGEA